MKIINKFKILIFRYKYLLSFSIISALLLFLIMRFSAGVSTDSIMFLNAAENIIDKGKIYITAYGMNIPMTHFPPLYPLSIALLSYIFNLQVEFSAKILGSITFGLNIFLSGIILNRLSQTNYKKQRNTLQQDITNLNNNIFFAIFLLALSEYMILIHCKVFTEPLFISFVLLSFIFIEKYLRNSCIFPLILAGSSVAAANLTRYAGLPLIPLGIVIILFLTGKPLKKRIRDSLIFLSIAFTPLLLWFIRNAMLANTATHRKMSFHPIGIPHIRQLIRSILFVFFPNSFFEYIKTASVSTALIVIALVILIFIIITTFAFHKLKIPSLKKIWHVIVTLNPMVKILLLFLITYPVFLFISISFADYTTPLSYRIMLPEFVVGFPLMIIGLIKLINLAYITNKKKIAIFLKLLLLLFLISYSFRAYILCTTIYSDGLEYASRTWKNSQLIKYIKMLPTNRPIYTNGDAAIFYHTKRITYAIPYKYINGKENPAYLTLLEKMKDNINKHNGVVIYFSNIPSTLIPSVQELRNSLALTIKLQADDGTVMSPQKK